MIISVEILYDIIVDVGLHDVMVNVIVKNRAASNSNLIGMANSQNPISMRDELVKETIGANAYASIRDRQVIKVMRKYRPMRIYT